MGLSNIPTRQLTGNKLGRFLKKLWGWAGYFTDIKGKEVIFNLHFIIFFFGMTHYPKQQLSLS